jgi:iron complex outermembrane receptor protein
MYSTSTTIRLVLISGALTGLARLSAQIADSPTSSSKDDAVTLVPVEVTASTPSGYVASSSSIGTRTGAPLNETPQSISVITAGLIRDQNAQNMSEVLRYSAGVRSEMYGVDNRGDWFSLRGGSEGSTLLNGLRRPLSGYWGNVRDEPFGLEQVEVLRGPSSVMAGQNGPGGVVNLVSKRPQAVSANEIAIQYGTYDHKQVSFDSTGGVNESGTVLYRVVGLVRDSETQVDHTQDERQFIAPSLTWRPNEDTSLTLLTEYQHDWSNNTTGFFPWSGMILPAPNGPIPDDTFIGEPDWDKYEGTRYRVGYAFDRKINDTWTLSHNARYDHVEGDIRGMYANFWEGGFILPDGRSLNRTWYIDRTHTKVANANLNLIGNFEHGRFEHTVLVGADILWSVNKVEGVSGAATPLDVYNPIYGTFPQPIAAFGPADRSRANEYGLTLQDQIKFAKRWVFVPGLRYDSIQSTVDNGDGYKDDALTTRVGLVFLADGGWSPYVSYSESFQGAPGVDFAGDAFKPLRGEQVEAGLKWAPANGRFSAAAAVYTLKETNRLTDDPVNVGESVQQGEVTVDGFELEGTAHFEAWDFLANYTYADAYLSKSSIAADPALDQRLQGIPAHSAAAWAVHKFDYLGAKGLRIGLGVRYVGMTEDGTGNDVLDTPSYTLWDGLVSYQRGPWTYSVNASNLFDKEYIATSLSRGDSWFGFRRKVVSSVAYRW